MKKISTPCIQIEEKNTEDSILTPRAITLAILRQFARAYRPAPVANMPGIVLN